jgi:hypothetical protein
VPVAATLLLFSDRRGTAAKPVEAGH